MPRRAGVRRSGSRGTNARVILAEAPAKPRKAAAAAPDWRPRRAARVPRRASAKSDDRAAGTRPCARLALAPRRRPEPRPRRRSLISLATTRAHLDARRGWWSRDDRGQPARGRARCRWLRAAGRRAPRPDRRGRGAGRKIVLALPRHQGAAGDEMAREVYRQPPVFKRADAPGLRDGPRRRTSQPVAPRRGA